MEEQFVELSQMFFLRLQRCSHVFCSLCIRRWFDSNCICPECRVPSSAAELYKVRLVEDVVELWDSLSRDVQTLNNLITNIQNHSDVCCATNEVSKDLKNTCYNSSHIAIDEECTSNTRKGGEESRVENATRTQGKRKRSRSETSYSSPKISECPICGIHISVRLIQHHVDICLTKHSYSNEDLPGREVSQNFRKTSLNADKEASNEAVFEKRPVSGTQFFALSTLTLLFFSCYRRLYGIKTLVIKS